MRGRRKGEGRGDCYHQDNPMPTPDPPLTTLTTEMKYSSGEDNLHSDDWVTFDGMKSILSLDQC